MRKIHEAYTAKIDRRWDIIHTNPDSITYKDSYYIDSKGEVMKSLEDFVGSEDFVVIGADSGLLYINDSKWTIQFYEKD